MTTEVVKNMPHSEPVWEFTMLRSKEPVSLVFELDRSSGEQGVLEVTITQFLAGSVA